MRRIRRRDFIRSAAGTAAAIHLSSIARAEQSAASGPDSSLPPDAELRLGVIGCGDRGRENLKQFLKFPQVRCDALCDVDEAMLGKAVQQVRAAGRAVPFTTGDFRSLLSRKEIDIVLISTPDHWHALPAVEACLAGKDVYVEKPLATTIAEGRAVVEAARRQKRIVQVGTQWRSAPKIAEAIQYVHSGQLGTIRQVRCWAYLSWLKSVGHPADTQAPAGVDYDRWLGPAPRRAFNPARFHFNFRWFWDYGGGLMTDWGLHLLNLAMWGMKVSSPTRVSAHGGKFAIDDIAETPDTQCAVYDFPGFTLSWEHQAQGSLAPENHYHGTAFYGTNGKLIVSADHWEVIPEKKKDLKPEKHTVDRGEGHLEHVRNFLECVISRKRPAMDVELGHQVTTAAHLGNIAYRTQRSLRWDGASETISGDTEAGKLLARSYRAPWSLSAL